MCHINGSDLGRGRSLLQVPEYNDTAHIAQLEGTILLQCQDRLAHDVVVLQTLGLDRTSKGM
jgi:hypothetical protein